MVAIWADAKSLWGKILNNVCFHAENFHVNSIRDFLPCVCFPVRFGEPFSFFSFGFFSLFPRKNRLLGD